MAERWIEAGYCVLLIDPEGDHVQLRQLNQVQVVDGGREPSRADRTGQYIAASAFSPGTARLPLAKPTGSALKTVIEA